VGIISGYRIRTAAEKDLTAILSIEGEVQNPGRWNRREFREELWRPGTTFLVAEGGHPNLLFVAGFLVILSAGADHEVLNLGVQQKHRRRGVGTALMEYFMARAAESGTGRLFLEVRFSNFPARCLYRKLGFQKVGLRRNYYRDPPEDAVIMSRNLW
jgi:ribosomal-protein-alanine N-acetyltransferase